jgi:hypothetical protein
MLVTPVALISALNFEQAYRKLLPICVTVLGMSFIVSRLLQFLKNSLPILVAVKS